MPPGQMRGTVFFQMGNYGWTETLFPPVGLGDYAAAAAAMNAYVVIRQGLMPNAAPEGPFIMYWRISDDSVFRDAQVQFFQPPLTGSITGGPESAFTALLIRLVASPLWRRPLYLRGLPETVVGDNGEYIPGPIAGQINTLRNFLLGPPAWFMRTTVAAVGNAPIKIQAIAPPNAFTTLTPHPFNAGDRVIIKGRSWHRNPTGIHTIAGTATALTFSLAGVDLPADYVYYPILSLSVQAKTPTYQPLVALNDERIVDRRTGRPFNLPRGRRSPVRV